MSSSTANRGAVSQQNDIDQCSQWLADFGDDLLAYALARVHDFDVAEDLVQETFLAAFQSVDRLDAEFETLRELVVRAAKFLHPFFR